MTISTENIFAMDLTYTVIALGNEMITDPIRITVYSTVVFVFNETQPLVEEEPEEKEVVETKPPPVVKIIVSTKPAFKGVIVPNKTVEVKKEEKKFE